MNGKEVEDHFEDRPGSLAIFRIVAERIDGLGPSDLEVRSQISFGRDRKFAWFWLYNVTQKNPDGVPHLMLALDHDARSDHVRQVDKVGKSRWNHQIVVRTKDDARSSWLDELIEQAYRYGGSD